MPSYSVAQIRQAEQRALATGRALMPLAGAAAAGFVEKGKPGLTGLLICWIQPRAAGLAVVVVGLRVVGRHRQLPRVRSVVEAAAIVVVAFVLVFPLSLSLFRCPTPAVVVVVIVVAAEEDVGRLMQLGG